MNAWVLRGYKKPPQEMAQIVCDWEASSERNNIEGGKHMGKNHSTHSNNYSSGGFTIALAFAVDEMADPLRTDYCVTAFRCSVFLGGIYYYKER